MEQNDESGDAGGDQAGGDTQDDPFTQVPRPFDLQTCFFAVGRKIEVIRQRLAKTPPLAGIVVVPVP